MIPLPVALVVAGFLLGTVAGFGAVSRQEESPASIPMSPDWRPRDFQFQIPWTAKPIDPTEHAEELRGQVDQLSQVRKSVAPLFPEVEGSGVPGSAEDVISFLATPPPNLWAEIAMPSEPRADFLGVTLLAFWVWAVYRASKRAAADATEPRAES